MKRFLRYNAAAKCFSLLLWQRQYDGLKQIISPTGVRNIGHILNWAKAEAGINLKEWCSVSKQMDIMLQKIFATLEETLLVLNDVDDTLGLEGGRK